MSDETLSLSHDGQSKRISLCMIVRNEGPFIRQCLSSVRDVVDEIIVVDTGCTDGTIETCHWFGARVVDFPWTEDFAAARNYGLKYASGEWILWLDADEQVDLGDAYKFRDTVVSTGADFYAVCLINFYGEKPVLDESYQISQLRVFRNRMGLRFEDKIHERLNVKGVEHIVNLPVRVYHYGYMPSVMKAKDKHNRNLKLLRAELEKPDYSPWIHYHIASELYNMSQLEAALAQLNFGILKFVLSGFKPPSMCYRLKYTILLQLNQIEDALLHIDKAIAIYPDYVDLHFLKGMLLYEQKEYAKAAVLFRQCVDLGEDSGNHLSLKGVGSFRAWHQLGLCNAALGQFDDAIQAYESSLTYSPDYPPARNSLTAMQGRLDD